MDKNYDVEAAAQRLEVLAADRYNSAHSRTQLSRIVSASAHYEAVSVGRSWIFVHQNTSEELVVFFQGIIVRKDLPPFTERLGRTSGHVKYLRQSVSIAGFDTPTFARAVDATAGIHAVLGRAVGIHNVSDCGIIGSVNDTQVLELSNRYFKHRQAGNVADEVALTSDLDPHGYLAAAALTNGLYHSEDNSVQYFERQGSGDEDYRYKNVKPLIFGVGDIVEVQASFVLFPLKEGKYKSGMVLRGLTLLDGSFTQARVRSLVIHRMPIQSQKIIKRKVGYNEEELSATRAKLARMEIDGNGEGTAERSADDLFDDKASSSFISKGFLGDSDAALD